MDVGRQINKRTSLRICSSIVRTVVFKQSSISITTQQSASDRSLLSMTSGVGGGGFESEFCIGGGPHDSSMLDWPVSYGTSVTRATVTLNNCLRVLFSVEF